VASWASNKVEYARPICAEAHRIAGGDHRAGLIRAGTTVCGWRCEHVSDQIDITPGNERVGTVRFLQPETGLAVSRIASGLRLQLPGSITFSAPSGSGFPLALEDLQVSVYAADVTKQVEIGKAHCDSIHTTPVRDSPVTFSWDCTLHAFAFYERIRAGRSLKFRLQL
jgi:hypothetical protein